MDRKYKQRGYMDAYRQEKPRSSPVREKEGRAPKLPGVREAFRCALCGHLMPVQFGVSTDSQCQRCGADLHACKNCLFFDTGSRFECSQPISLRIAPKDKRNRCDFFKVRITVERETSTSLTQIKDPRQAFNKLFKP
jgi:hypothetical protein